MKSVIQEGSSLAKAIEQGWIKAGKPKEFTIKIFQEAKKNFFGFTTIPAKVGIFFKDFSSSSEHKDIKHNSPRPQHQQNREKRDHRDQRDYRQQPRRRFQKRPDDRSQNPNENQPRQARPQQPQHPRQDRPVHRPHNNQNPAQPRNQHHVESPRTDKSDHDETE